MLRLNVRRLSDNKSVSSMLSEETHTGRNLVSSYLPAFDTSRYSKVLVIVLDQFPFNSLPRMHRLLNEISPYRPIIKKCEVRHIPTLTQSGHAAIVTGRSMGKNGIVGDCWFNREDSSLVKFNGNISYLTSPTISDIACVNGFRVACVSGKKDVTSLLGNSMFLPESLRGKTLSFEPSSILVLAKDGLRYEPGSGEWIASVAEACLEKYLNNSEQWCLIVSFSNLDKVGHRYGIDSEHYEREVLKVEDLIINLLRKVDLNDTLVIIVGDHGAIQLKNIVRINKSRKHFEFYELDDGVEKFVNERKIPDFIVENTYSLDGLISDGGLLRVYLQRQELEVLIKVKNEFLYALEEYINPLRMYDSQSPIYKHIQTEDKRNGDLLVMAKKGIGFLREEWRNVLTAHGSNYEEDRIVPLLILDSKGMLEEYVNKPVVSQVEIAPLISKCLGLRVDKGYLLKIVHANEYS